MTQVGASNRSPAVAGRATRRATFFPRQDTLATDVVTVLGATIGAWCFGCGYQSSTASITKNPITYASATCHPPRTQAIASLPSGNMFDNATPADEPNQIIEPPKPTAYARYPQS